MTELRESLALLTNTARVLRRRRAALGALELESAEVRVAVDKAGTIDRLLTKVSRLN
jgi:exoribonuclease R